MVSARRPSERNVVIDGNFSAFVVAECHRCCQPVEVKLAAAFVYDCIVGSEEPGEGRETECRDEDYQRLYVEEPIIDLGELLREQVFLAMPASVLCDEQCRGLCAGCGVDLNRADCICQDIEESSPFAILRHLKDK